MPAYTPPKPAGWQTKTFGTSTGSMGMAIERALNFSKTLRTNRSRLDDAVNLIRQAQTRSEIVTPTNHIAGLADRSYSVGSQVADRANTLANHRITPRVNNLPPGTLTSQRSASGTPSASGPDRVLFNRRPSGSSSALGTGPATASPSLRSGTGIAGPTNRFLEVNTTAPAASPPTVIKGTSVYGPGFDPGANRSRDRSTGWEGYAALPGGEFDGLDEIARTTRLNNADRLAQTATKMGTGGGYATTVMQRQAEQIVAAETTTDEAARAAVALFRNGHTASHAIAHAASSAGQIAVLEQSYSAVGMTHDHAATIASVTITGHPIDTPLINELLTTGMNPADVASLVDQAAHAGQSVQEAYMRSIADDMTSAEIVEAVGDNFDEWANADGFVTTTRLQEVLANTTLPEAQRAVALALLSSPILFRSAETATQTDIEQGLYEGVFDIAKADGQLSREDIAAFAETDRLLRTLAPWAIVLDSATGKPANREITDAEVKALLANPSIPLDVKQAVVTVLGAGSETGTHTALLAAPPAGALLPSSAPTIAGVGSATPTALSRLAALRAAISWPLTLSIVGFAVGTKAGTMLADPGGPTEIAFFDPTSGARHTIDTEALRDYPTTDLGQAINILVATGKLPTPEQLTYTPPDTYTDPNGQTRDTKTGDLVDSITGETIGSDSADAVTGDDRRDKGSIVPEGWVSRVADNGKGTVWQPIDAQGSEDMVRVMAPTARYPHGYVRYYNAFGQPVNLAGKPDSRSKTHFPISSDGTVQVPIGWNNESE